MTWAIPYINAEEKFKERFHGINSSNVKAITMLATQDPDLANRLEDEFLKMEAERENYGKNITNRK